MPHRKPKRNPIGVLDSPAALALALLAAFCIGMSKAGFSGISLIAIFIMADLYGAVPSTGIMLPLLIAADLAVYPAFRKHGSWKPVWKLLPATLAGLAIGVWLLKVILVQESSDQVARRVIGGCILAMVALQAFRAWKPVLAERLANARSFGTAAGITGGITTMLANAAGPVIQLYLLSRRIPKMELLGIGARFFLLVNLVKVPLSGSFNLITPATLWDNLKCLPAIFAGIWVGKWLVQRVSQRAFEWLVIGFSLIVAGRLLLA
ncbi:sulfite exporter TauE/SafE family protein [Luteolibacter flavescens]|uniref:Probable membrane transporter protein n=1 Tax=Luteolibacter flavescens TaxID=1859460 RepID=A0ABT3FJ63_9BACT|nr:sulfite exporter TauE/SafE family protein [Luteolibacter flavescens]MCW1883608.1 sulfite exporter TauE/SafE family protein [Luteolibacter flavescens]